MVIRVDDFPSGSPSLAVIYGYRDKFLKFHEKMQGVPYLLAAVPFHVESDDKALGLLRSIADSVSIGVHGYDHTSEMPQHAYCEFAGRSQEEVDKRIREGIDILSEFSPRVYVPPFNRTTLYAIMQIRKGGIKFITGGPETTIDTFAGYLPSSLYACASEKTTSCESAVRIIERDGIPEGVHTLHWTWIHGEKHKGLDKYINLIRKSVEDWDSFLDVREKQWKI